MNLGGILKIQYRIIEIKFDIKELQGSQFLNLYYSFMFWHSENLFLKKRIASTVYRFLQFWIMIFFYILIKSYILLTECPSNFVNIE
jgi:hypothetical protein